MLFQKVGKSASLYITTSAYPEGCTDIRKRIIRKKAKKFHVSDGELFCYVPSASMIILLIYTRYITACKTSQ